MADFRDETEKLKRNLTALVEFSRAVNASRDLDFTLENLLFSAMGKFLASRGAVALFEGGELRLARAKGVADQAIEEFPRVGLEDDAERALRPFLDRRGFAVLQPIDSARERIGYLLLGEKITGKPYADEELEFLGTVVNIAATGLENSRFIAELERVNRDLDSRVNRLNSLFELSKEFGVLSDARSIGKLLVYSLLGEALASTYAVAYCDDGAVRVPESTAPKSELKETLSCADVRDVRQPATGETFCENFKRLAAFGFEAIAPMRLQNETRGIILLGKRADGRPHLGADLEFIQSVGSLAIVALENRRLFNETLEKYKLEEELELAKEIQRGLLPSEIPQTDHFEIAAASVSSRQVGGDYYDVIDLGEERTLVAVADVSGKGAPASLLMANLQAFLKSVVKRDMPLAEATALVNDLVAENTADGKFITFFWGVLDGAKKTFEYVNAGHNPTILLREGKIRWLDKGGLLLGVVKTLAPYEREIVELRSGDLIVMFTDGVTEAMNAKGEEFSDARFERLVARLGDGSAREALAACRDAVADYTKGEPQSDDITLVCVKAK
ncbi:MAG: SpoIIE family protein phosphatase [Ignavibacteriales bacterium]|nr:SpoIIE family protein phosphatase [Ignavibacteriales bacterium]